MGRNDWNDTKIGELITIEGNKIENYSDLVEYLLKEIAYNVHIKSQFFAR